MNNIQKVSNKRFFIALIPPKDVQEEATKIKEHFRDVYNSKAALKISPSCHLTTTF
ncbi:2'-5' RNA ligase [Crocosphaera watsonii WH 0402]|uniref:2'-5' RNA ligase n=1 Tax=Crocosphaera watsonii WH 0402 TaxID=1284629 RepID=T2JTB5_CROWT|nr:2'-5' RNA ligase [Crocosphaera watsonii WH 0402]